MSNKFLKNYKQKDVRLNKSNLRFVLPVLFLIISIQLPLYSTSLRGLAREKVDLKVTTVPAKPKQGDTLIIKVPVDKDEKSKPKIFFDKKKYSAFPVGGYYRAFVPLEANIKTGKHSIDVHYGRGVKYLDVIVNKTNYIIENITLSKSASGLMASRKELKEVGNALYAVSDEKMWSGKFLFPSQARQSTPYGRKRRFNGVLSPGYFHKGLDFAGQTGSPVIAPERGKVILVGYNKEGYNVNGNCVFLDHGHGVVSAYLHLNKILVKQGDIVEKGKLIGKVGSTGIATGPHLHWGVYVNGKAVEPLYWTSQAVQ